MDEFRYEIERISDLSMKIRQPTVTIKKPKNSLSPSEINKLCEKLETSKIKDDDPFFLRCKSCSNSIVKSNNCNYCTNTIRFSCIWCNKTINNVLDPLTSYFCYMCDNVACPKCKESHLVDCDECNILMCMSCVKEFRVCDHGYSTDRETYD